MSVAQTQLTTTFRVPWRRNETFALSVVGLLFAHGLISALIAGSLIYEGATPGPHLIAMLLGLGVWLAFWATLSRQDMVSANSIFFFTLVTTATVVALTTLSIGDSAPAVLFLPVAAVIAGSTMPRRTATISVLSCAVIAVLGILVGRDSGVFAGSLTSPEARIFESLWVQGFGIVGLTSVGGLVATRISSDWGDLNDLVPPNGDSVELKNDALSELLARGIKTGVARFDSKGSLMFANESFAQMIGQILPSERQKYDLWTLVRTIPHLATALSQSSEGFVEGEMTLGRRKHIFSIRVMTVSNQESKGPDLLVLMDDNTSQRAMERLALRGEHAERVSLLARGISHDLANTMTVAQGLSTVVQRQLPEGSPLRNDLHLVISACRRTAQLGKEVISLESNETLSETETSSIENTVRAQRSLLNRLTPAHMDIRFDVDESLPDVFYSETSLARIIMNLATYCIGSTDKIGRIQFDFRETGPSSTQKGVHLTLRDDGPKISVAEQEDLLEGRATGTWTEPSLALAIVRVLVESQGGRVWASEATQAFPGTSLEVFFPSREIRNEVSPNTTTKPLRNLASRPMVWVIEDSHVHSGKVVAALAKRGFLTRISRTHDGVRRDIRSLVRLDLLVLNPDVMGAESMSFIRSLRQRFPDLPILVLDHEIRSPEYQVFDSKDGGLSYISTPFDVHTLDGKLDYLKVVTLT